MARSRRTGFARSGLGVTRVKLSRPEGENIKLTAKSSNWGGRRPGAGRPRKPRGAPVTVASEVWPAAELVDASLVIVEALARSCTRAALMTLLLIAEWGSDEGVRVSAAGKFLDIARRLGALRRPRRQ